MPRNFTRTHKFTVYQLVRNFKLPFQILILILIAGIVTVPAKAQEIEDVSVSAKLTGLRYWISLDIVNIAGASISQLTEVLGSSEIKITVDANGGGWIGVSLRDSRGRIYNIPAQEVRTRGNEFYWTVPSDFPDGAIECTVALWNDYNESSDLMEGELDRINWSYIARKSGGSAY